MYIATYDPHPKLVESTIRQWCGMLQREPKYGYLFKETPLFVYRKGKSIGN